MASQQPEHISYDLIIIGSGFSGIALAYNLAKQIKDKASFSCAIFEAQSRIAAGIAYATQEPAQLLNVPAEKMSIDSEDPTAFYRWLLENSLDYSASDFVARRYYHRYLLAVTEELHNPAVNFQFINKEIISLKKADSGYIVECEDAYSVQAPKVVLAIGNSLDLDSTSKSGEILQNPWNTLALNEAYNTKEVTIIGTGLSAADVILSLEQRSYKGNYTLVSRRGLLPQPHKVGSILSKELESFCEFVNNSQSTISILRKIRLLTRQGIDWYSLIDSLRSQTSNIWRNLSPKQKKSFMRHLKPFWESHRHRIPQASHNLIQQLQQQKRLRILKAKLVSFRKDQSFINLSLQTKSKIIEINSNVVFDCRGLWSNISKSPSPLINSILQNELGRADETGLGFSCDKNGQLLDSRGQVSRGLYTLGSLRRADLWESTAVSEIREQAKEIIQEIVLSREQLS